MQEKPLFLLSNDDGVHAPGIKVLREAVREFGETVIVAPHVERSGASQMISIHQPLRMEKIDENTFAVEGTPADCVLLAIRKILRRRPAMVISGINRGANLGQDIMYSGTVGAALEGAVHGIPGLAVSCYGEGALRYETAGLVVQWILRHRECLDQFMGVCNVNVPSVRPEQLEGLKFAKPGRRLYEQDMVESIDPRGRPYFWIGGGGTASENIPDSDCILGQRGYATLSVLKPCLYDQREAERLETIFPEFRL